MLARVKGISCLFVIDPVLNDSMSIKYPFCHHARTVIKGLQGCPCSLSILTCDKFLNPNVLIFSQQQAKGDANHTFAIFSINHLGEWRIPNEPFLSSETWSKEICWTLQRVSNNIFERNALLADLCLQKIVDVSAESNPLLVWFKLGREGNVILA